MGTTQEPVLEGPSDLAPAVLDIPSQTGELAAAPDTSEPSASREPAGDLETVFRNGSERIQEITNALGQFCHSKDPRHKASVLAEMHGHLRQLRSELGGAHLGVLGTFCGCLGRLLSSLGSNPEVANPSKLRTISNGIDFLRTTLSSQLDCREVENKPLRALVVDDDPVCRRAMSLALTSAVLQTVVCESGEQALEQLGPNRVDVIFTDIMMPGLNGYDLARKIRELPGCWSTPIIFVTSLSDFEARSRSILSGGCELIAKPITASELVVKAFTFALRYRMTSEELSPVRVADVPTRPSRIASAHRLGIVHIDPSGAVQKLNQEAAHVLGYHPEELLGHPLAELFADELQSGNDSITIGVLLDGEYKTRRGVKMLARRKDQRVEQFAVTVSEPLSSEFSGFIVFLRRLETAADTAKALDNQAAQNPRGATHDSSGSRALPGPAPLSAVSPPSDKPRRPETSEAASGLESKVAQLELLNRETSAKLQGLMSSEEELRTRCESLEAELKASRQQASDARRQLTSESDARAAAEQQSAELASRRARLEEALAQQGRAHQETVSRLEQAEARLQKLAQFQSRLEVAEQEAATLRAALAEAGQQHARLAANLDSTAAREGELRDQCQALNQELDAARHLLTEAQQRLNEQATLKSQSAALEVELQRAAEARARENESERELILQLRLECRQECDRHAATQQRLQEIETAAQQQRESWERRVSQLDAAVKDNEERIAALAQIESTLQTRCAAMAEELSQAQALLQREADGRVEAERALSALQEQQRLLIEQSRSEHEQLESAHAGARRELEQERKERHQMRQLLDELGDALEQEKQKRLYWEQQSSTSSAALKDANQRLTSLTQKVAALETESSASDERLRSAQEGLERETEARRVADRCLAELREQEHAAGEALQQAHDRVRQLNGEVDRIRAELEAQRCAAIELKRSLEQERAGADELVENLAAAELDKVALQDRILEAASAEQQARAKMAALETALGALHEEQARRDAELAEAHEREQHLAARCADADQLSTRLQSDLAAARREAAVAGSKCDQLESALQDTAAASAQLHERCSSLERTVGQLEQQRQGHRGELEQESALRQLAEARQSELARTLARLEQDWGLQTQARARLRQQLSIAHRRFKTLSHEAQAQQHQRALSERQLAEIRVLFDSKQREIASLESRLRAAETDSSHLTERLTRTEILLGEALTARGHMETQNLELNGTLKRLSEKLTLLQTQASLCRRIAELDTEASEA